MTTKDERMRRGIEAAFHQMHEIIKNPEAHMDSAVFIIDLSNAPEIFSPERVRLLQRLRDSKTGFDSVTELAKALRRDPSRVSRDLDVLEDAGLVVRKRVGKAKKIVYRRGPIMLT